MCTSHRRALMPYLLTLPLTVPVLWAGLYGYFWLMQASGKALCAHFGWGCL